MHPFPEGNTRTTAVFAIKYLKLMGYEIDNEQFERHSWYFRNALVRANYSNRSAGVSATRRYLDMFFGNLLLGGDHELKNRFMHVDFERPGLLANYCVRNILSKYILNYCVRNNYNACIRN